jgi:hypothetical protein
VLDGAAPGAIAWQIVAGDDYIARPAKRCRRGAPAPFTIGALRLTSADLVGMLAVQAFACEPVSHAECTKSRMRGKQGIFVVFGIETSKQAIFQTQFQ